MTLPPATTSRFVVAVTVWVTNVSANEMPTAADPPTEVAEPVAVVVVVMPSTGAVARMMSAPEMVSAPAAASTNALRVTLEIAMAIDGAKLKPAEPAPAVDVVVMA